MIRFGQSNDLPDHILPNSMMNFWPMPVPSNNVFTEDFDGITKQEHEDVILLDSALPVSPLDIDLDSISDFLDTTEPNQTMSFTQPLNIHDRFSSSSHQSQSSQNPSFYSSLGISPQFNGLSIHPSKSSTFSNHRATSIPEHDHLLLATSYPLPVQSFSVNTPDVKRFRSASMNDGSMHYNDDANQFDNYRHKKSNCLQNFQPVKSSDSSRVLPSWMPCFGNENPRTTSLIEEPDEEWQEERIRTSSYNTVENPSENELWSDIEQNSCEALHENGLSSDEETDIQQNQQNANANANVNSSLFWQYNVQSKGPKTKRVLYLKERDPHIYREFSDPVYQIKLTQNKGQLVNKLRKGDGNDVTPNPAKLYELGQQIQTLSKDPTSVYHGIYHVDQQVQSNDTADVKKEKNKLASRACRLRKKAKHEANKLKLHGLNEEHKSLVDTIAAVKLLILQRYENGQNQLSSFPLNALLDQIIVSKCNNNVAGNTDGFVQTILNQMEQYHTSKKRNSNSCTDN